MVLALSIFSIVALLELTLWIPFVWRWRRPLAICLIPAVAVSIGWLVSQLMVAAAVLLVFFGIYRLINLLRLIEGRTQVDYLFHAARVTSLTLIGLQIASLGVAYVTKQVSIPATQWLLLVAGFQLLAAIVLVRTTRHNLRATLPPGLTSTITDHDLPTLTVAIPARNETDDLEACLRSLLTSNYPKLEILVLDDCSQERRTPEIIRSFAHDGVRFIAGEVPPEQWLAKNYAYERLVEASSGDIILFCGVDVRFGPSSLRALVSLLEQKQKRMLSIIPANNLPKHPKLGSLLIQPSRYAWELSVPRRWLHHTPVISTCWLISRQELAASGGFKAVSHSITPESYFARQAVVHGDSYSFMQSDDAIAISCAKDYDEQRATAIRTRYPQLHRRPELAALLTLAEATVLLLPMAVLLIALLTQVWLAAVLATVSCLIQIVTFHAITRLTYRQKMLGAWWRLPLAVIYDLILLNLSMWRYEFSEVIWKDRNICVPVMRAIPHLPNIEF